MEKCLKSSGNAVLNLASCKLDCWIVPRAASPVCERDPAASKAGKSEGQDTPRGLRTKPSSLTPETVTQWVGRMSFLGTSGTLGSVCLPGELKQMEKSPEGI